MITLEKDGLLLVSPDQVTAEQLAEYCIRNREFLKEFEPPRTEEYYTAAHQQELLNQDLENWDQRRGYRFYVKEASDPDRVIGSMALSNIVWGAFYSCFLGGKLDKDRVSQGYGTRAVGMIVDFAFNQLGLHRIEANVMPRNKRSLRSLEKSGFENEGLSRYYLNINGVWEDHIHMVKLNYAMHEQNHV